MAQSTAVPQTNPTNTDEQDSPIVLDLGKRSRKQVRRLRKGNGKLMDRIESVIEDLKKDGTVNGSVQPIIVVVRQKPKRTTFGF